MTHGTLEMLHPLDLGVILIYLVAMVGIGVWATRRVRSQEDFFMGSRVFGKVRSLFITFGMATSSETAVSTSREAYRQGFAGIWVNLFSLFVTPTYWILSAWYRRLRMISTSDLLRARFQSRGLEVLYAVVALVYFMGHISVGLLALQKTVEVLMPKPVAAYTAEDQARVAAFERFKALEAQALAGALPDAEQQELERLAALREKGWAAARSGISWIDPVWFQILIASVVVAYSIAGGLTAAAATDQIQGMLMIVLSVLLLPAALMQIGGFSGLHDAVPESAFNVFGSLTASEYPWYYVGALVLMGMAGSPGSPNNLSTMGGAARDDLAARIGTTYGTFLKRFTIIMWGFTGVVGWALFHRQVSDPDMIWGYMTRQLLGPGLIGMMIVCLLAAVMSSADAFLIGAGALVSRNLYGQLAPRAGEAARVLAGRIAGFVVMAGAVLICLAYDDMLRLLKFVWFIPLCFGPIIWLAIVWRRTTRLGAWAAVAYSLLTAVVLANGAEYVPALNRSAYFTRMTRAQAVMVEAPAEEKDVADGRAQRPGQVIRRLERIPPKPVFFERIYLADTDDPDAPAIGSGRLKVSLVVLDAVGVPLERMSFAALNACGFALDTVCPFLIVIVFSLLGKPVDPGALDRFYAVLHTPTDADPQEDARQVRLSLENPRRFEGRKLMPGTSIELMRPDLVTCLGFFVTVGVVALIFLFMLGLASLTWP